MSELNLRIQILEQAAKGINPAKDEYHSQTNDALTSLRDDELIRFKPDNIVNSHMKIELTDSGVKRLDEMKRSKYPAYVTYGIPAAVIALIALLVKIFTGE